MCLQITRFSKLHTAKEDMVVYKFIYEDGFNDNQYITPYMGDIVEIGKTYNSNLEIDKYFVANFLLECRKGLHSLKTLKGLKKIMKNRYHAIPVKCIIPKGAHYYIGWFCKARSYASDSLIYSEIINL